MLTLRVMTVAVLVTVAVVFAAPGQQRASATGSFHGKHQQAAHGARASSGYKNSHDVDKTHQGRRGREDENGKYNVAAGTNDKHLEDGGQYAEHRSAEKGHRAAKFGEKKGHKRGHKTKGYHNTFHRDEHHREHRFYDDFHRSGAHQKHGQQHSKYDRKHGGHKKGGTHHSGNQEVYEGRDGEHAHSQHEDEHRGHQQAKGAESYQQQAGKYRQHTNGDRYAKHRKH